MIGYSGYDMHNMDTHVKHIVVDGSMIVVGLKKLVPYHILLRLCRFSIA